jgi:flagellin-like protein
MKGISPVVATVLLIAITVGMVGLVSVFTTDFFRTTTDTVKSQSDTQIDCSFSGVSLHTLRFANNYLSGHVENVGKIVLGNVSINVIYQNSTTERFDLCDSGSNTVRCSAGSGNTSLSLSELNTFNIAISSSTYDRIRVFTNCTEATDTAQRGDVAS